MHTITHNTLTERLAGAWLIAKLKAKQRTSSTFDAAIRAKKYGVPADLCVLILATRGTK